MTSQQTDQLPDTEAAAAAAVSAPEPHAPGMNVPTPDGEARPAGIVGRTRQAVVGGTAAAVRRPASGVASVARTSVSTARRGAATVIAHLPGTLGASRDGMRGTIGALQTLPDPTLRSVAATSVGLGVGLYLTRANRMAIVAGLVPAVLTGAAIIARPIEPSVPEGAGG
jgi:hypothetical protein